MESIINVVFNTVLGFQNIILSGHYNTIKSLYLKCSMIHKNPSMPFPHDKPPLHEVAQFNRYAFCQAVVFMVCEAWNKPEAQFVPPHDLVGDVPRVHCPLPQDVEDLLPEFIGARNQFHSIARIRPRPISVTTTTDITSIIILS